MSYYVKVLKRSPFIALGLCTLLLTACAAQPLNQPKHEAQQAAISPLPDAVGVLVIAPDRGFVGNQDVRRAYQKFAQTAPASQLLFVTDERSKTIFNQRLTKLQDSGVDNIVVVPLVTSTADPRWKLAQQWLGEHDAVRTADIYGHSYLAVEDLSQRLRDSGSTAKHLVLVGYGADNAQAAEQMREELQKLAKFASDLPADAIQIAIYPKRGAKDYSQLKNLAEKTLKQAHNSLVVPVAMAPRASTMMSFEGWYKSLLPKGSDTLPAVISNADHLTQWMQLASQKTSLAIQPADAQHTGIVALVHGADWFWNQAIRDALSPIAEQYPVEYAFSMADQFTVAHAIDRLEKRGVRRILIVRTYSMASSFLPLVNRMTGIDVAQNQPQHGPMMMHHGGDHHHHANLAAKARIRASVPLTTAGGVEDDALFARALLENARSVSKDPKNEVVIVVAHGRGGDKANQHWLDNLDSLTQQMRSFGGDDFADIQYATWREDWPEKRKHWVATVRSMVEKAQAEGSRVLIVPARINGRGDAKHYLEGLDFAWSEGFAQTDYFAQWFKQTIQQAAF